MKRLLALMMLVSTLPACELETDGSPASQPYEDRVFDPAAPAPTTTPGPLTPAPLPIPAEAGLDLPGPLADELANPDQAEPTAATPAFGGPALDVPAGAELANPYHRELGPSEIDRDLSLNYPLRR
jgi:hypothetical protein